MTDQKASILFLENYQTKAHIIIRPGLTSQAPMTFCRSLNL